MDPPALLALPPHPSTRSPSGAPVSAAVAGMNARAARRLGELVRELPKAKGGSDSKTTGPRARPVNQPPTLAEEGIDKREAAMIEAEGGTSQRTSQAPRRSLGLPRAAPDADHRDGGALVA